VKGLGFVGLAGLMLFHAGYPETQPTTIRVALAPHETSLTSAIDTVARQSGRLIVLACPPGFEGFTLPAGERSLDEFIHELAQLTQTSPHLTERAIVFAVTRSPEDQALSKYPPRLESLTDKLAQVLATLSSEQQEQLVRGSVLAWDALSKEQQERILEAFGAFGDTLVLRQRIEAADYAAIALRFSPRLSYLHADQAGGLLESRQVDLLERYYRDRQCRILQRVGDPEIPVPPGSKVTMRREGNDLIVEVDGRPFKEVKGWWQE